MWEFALLICPRFKSVLYPLSSFHFLDIPANDILELFGRMFFDFCQDSGYDKILQVLGATPRDFLQVNRMSRIHYFLNQQ